jgi:methionyl aminopeptidase
MKKINIKTDEEFQIMVEGGKLLNKIKKELVNFVKVGVNAKEVDDLAEKLILESGARSSFKMVPNYSWSTCINVNSGVVHGIPHKSIVFKEDDLISIDLGLFYKGFHTDTSVSLCLNPTEEVKKFLEAGKEAFKTAVKAIIPNRSYIYDISYAIEETLVKHGLTPILDLTGHGIGKELHEAPFVPCFADGIRIETPKIVPGMALAIEVMYTIDDPDIVKAKDGWTLETRDGKIAGLFEDTIIVTEKGSLIIT